MRGEIPTTSSRGAPPRGGTHRVSVIVGTGGIKGVWLAGADHKAMQIDGAAARLRSLFYRGIPTSD